MCPCRATKGSLAANNKLARQAMDYPEYTVIYTGYYSNENCIPQQSPGRTSRAPSVWGVPFYYPGRHHLVLQYANSISYQSAGE